MPAVQIQQQVAAPFQQQPAVVRQQIPNEEEESRAQFYKASFDATYEENQRLQLQLAEQDSLANQAATEIANCRAELARSQQRQEELQAEFRQGFQNLRETLSRSPAPSPSFNNLQNEIRLVKSIMNNRKEVSFNNN